MTSCGPLLTCALVLVSWTAQGCSKDVIAFCHQYIPGEDSGMHFGEGFSCSEEKSQCESGRRQWEFVATTEECLPHKAVWCYVAQGVFECQPTESACLDIRAEEVKRLKDDPALSNAAQPGACKRLTAWPESNPDSPL